MCVHREMKEDKTFVCVMFVINRYKSRFNESVIRIDLRWRVSYFGQLTQSRALITKLWCDIWGITDVDVQKKIQKLRLLKQNTHKHTQYRYDGPKTQKLWFQHCENKKKYPIHASETQTSQYSWKVLCKKRSCIRYSYRNCTYMYVFGGSYIAIYQSRHLEKAWSKVGR